MVADDDGRYVDVNRAAEELLGLKREELLGKRISDFVAPIREPSTDRMWKDFKQEGVQEGYFVVSRADGTDRVIYYRARMNVLPGLHLSIAFDMTHHRGLMATEE